MAKRYPVFLQALALTIFVFIIGFYIGIGIEGDRFLEINKNYIQSEASLVDILALDGLVDDFGVSCDVLEKSNRDLLDRVYEEAILLEDYENSGKMTDNLESFHKKYDVLRTYLWINAIKIKSRCNSNFSTAVYLYDSEQEDLEKKAMQNVWSKLLYEVKQIEKENLFLVPIAYDTNLTSLKSLIAEYEIEEFPVVIVNEKIVFRGLVTKEEFLDSLN